MNSPRLNEKMEIPVNGAFPSAEQIRRAEIKFACIRGDNVKYYYDKMLSNEDINMRNLLTELTEKIMEQAFRGKISVDFKCYYESSRVDARVRDCDIEIYRDTVIQYDDGTYHKFEDYLDVATYMRAMCEFLFDFFTSDDMRYDVCAHRSGPPGKGIVFKKSREDTIRRAFDDTSLRKEGFCLLISWGDDNFAEAVTQMETMSQYDAYISGVPLADILA